MNGLPRLESGISTIAQRCQRRLCPTLVKTLKLRALEIAKRVIALIPTDLTDSPAEAITKLVWRLPRKEQAVRINNVLNPILHVNHQGTLRVHHGEPSLK